jgi:DNA polymerase-1
MIGIDFETLGLEPEREKLRLIQTANGGADGAYVLDAWADGVDVERALGALARHDLVAHNASFEESWMRAWGVEFPQGMHDTMIAWMVLQQADAPGSAHDVPHGLGHVAKEVLDVDLDKEMQTSDWGDKLSERQLDYAALDAGILPTLFAELMRRIEAEGLEFVYDIERRARPAFDWMTRTGIYVDVPQLRLAMDELRGEFDEKGAWLQENAPINWGSSKQLIEFFSLDKKKRWPKTDGGKPSTRMLYLKRLDHPAIPTYERWKKLRKLFNTYGEGWVSMVHPDGRLRPRWLQFGTETGRVSCEEPNVQNIPKKGPHREAMVAPPGRVLIVADYSQIELRITAKHVEDEALLDIFARRRDVHEEMAQAITGKTEISEEERDKAKAANFGLTYGCGIKGFIDIAAGYGITLSYDESKKIINTFRTMYPSVFAWHEDAYDYKRGEYPATRTMAGRARGRFNIYTDWLNAPIQGTGADGAKLALALLWERRGEVPSAAPVNFIHDEIVVECDEADADRAKAWLETAMIDGMEQVLNQSEPYVPIEVEAKPRTVWGK